MTDPWAERWRLAEDQYRDDPSRFAGSESAFARWAAERLEDEVGSRVVLDLGGGPGRDARYLAGRGWKVRTVDFSPTAVARALEARSVLTEPARSRWTIVEAEVGRYLATESPGSVDAVFAHLLYATFSERELTATVAAVHRVLRPGGIHLIGLRDPSDPLAGKGTRVGPRTYLGGPHAVAYRYFALEDLDAAVGAGSVRVATSRSPSDHELFAAYRRTPEPAEPNRPGGDPRATSR
ncbi:MAG TPA: class I SAM-dependent methyltransferase [Thermoplasmata archaeon]|nr:class I SAM-dependent methyltransferase [Thermoplasmata archaeon]